MKHFRLFNSGRSLITRLTLLLTLLLGSATSAWADKTLTINDGSDTNAYVPFYMGGVAAGLTYSSTSQFIIPSDDITDLKDYSISKITFYSDSESASFGALKMDVYFKEVDNTVFSSLSFVDWDSMTKTYSGSVTVSSNKMEIVLDDPYLYESGKNLLIGFKRTVTGTNNSSKNWIGVNVSGNTALYHQYSYTYYKFLPKITFTYEEAGEEPVSVASPTGLTASSTTPISTELTWTNGGDETTWQLSYSTERGDHSTTTSDFTTKPYTLSGLTYNTTYYVSIRAKKGSTYSDWSDEISFKTENAVAVTSVTVDPTEWEMVAGDTKTLTATISPNDATIKDVTWESSNTSVATVNSSGVVTAVAPGDATITVTSTFDGEITASCDITVAAPVTPTAFKAKDITSNFASLTWTNGSTEDTWQIRYGTNGGSLELSGTPSGDINSKPYKIYRLNPNTTYYAIIRSKLGSAYSEWSEPLSFTTPSVGSAPKGGTSTKEDFEGGWPTTYGSQLSNAKDGWGYVTGYGRYYVKDTYAASGKGLYANSNSGTVQYIITPWVEAGSTITFWSQKTTSDGFVRLYKAYKSGDNYYVDTSVKYADVSLTDVSSTVESTTSSEITDGGYVAIQLNYAAIDDFTYTTQPNVSVITDNYGFTTFANSNILDMTGTNLPSGLEAYKAKVDGSFVRFTQLDQNVPANTGVLLKGNANTEYRIAIASTSTAVEDNEFLVNTGGTTFDADEGYTYFAMKKNGNPLVFATFDPSSVTIPSNKAYLKVETSKLPSETRQLVFSFDEDKETGINSIENGKLKIENEAIYNLAGQRVEKPVRGLYIVNGKKMVVK